MIVLLPGQASDHTAWDFSAAPVKQYRMGFFHFSNNNLSMRQACAQDIGRYDVHAAKSEDVDVCFRVARSAQWIALREKGNVVRHKARKTLSAFVRQMWGWGYHVGYPYAKTGIKGIYIYWLSSSKHTITFDVEIASFPFLVCLFVTDFHLWHVSFGCALLFMLCGLPLAALLSGALGVVFCWRYLYDDRHAGLGAWQTCQLAALHYLANIVFTVATVLGALKHGIVLLPSSIFRPYSPEEDRQR